MAGWLASNTSDVNGFVEWSTAQPVQRLPQTTAVAALAQLQSTRFSDMNSVLALHNAFLNHEPIPVVRTKQTQYFLVSSPVAVTMKGTLKRNSASENETAPDSKPLAAGDAITVHTYFVTPVQATPGGTPAGSALPQFVYPLGVVRQRDRKYSLPCPECTEIRSESCLGIRRTSPRC